MLLETALDDQAQQRIRLESEAVLALLAAPPAQLQFNHVSAHDLGNAQNAMLCRAALVRDLLGNWPLAPLDNAHLVARTDTLIQSGFKNYEAYHLASAELAGANV